MHHYLIMTVIGPDKPGLVESVSKTVEAHGGNWLESRMAHLAGQFAGILRVEIASDGVEALMADLRALERIGLRVVVEQSDGARADQPPKRVHLELIGQDRPGIVHHVTSVLVTHGVNIDELTTKITSAPMTGDPMFFASALLQVAPGTDLEVLRTALEDIANDLMVELTLSEQDG